MALITRQVFGEESMIIDLDKVPFSKFGSYLMLSTARQRVDDPNLYIRSAHSGKGIAHIFKITLARHGENIPYKITATPWQVRLESQNGAVEFCFKNVNTIAFTGTNVDICFELFEVGSFGNAIQRSPQHCQVLAWNNRLVFLFSAIEGELQIDAPWISEKCRWVKLIFSGEKIGGLIEAGRREIVPRMMQADFPAIKRDAQKEFEAWLAKMPPVPDTYLNSAKLAWYILWESVVEPDGFFKRPAMLSSKNWMPSVWAWDHCFNVLALARSAPELAWDQFMLMFDAQLPNGALPDAINNTSLTTVFTKPPIHGWTLRVLMERSKCVDGQKLREIYAPLKRWTDWWFEERDDDADGIPQYNHGNDSGWDNATVFDEGAPIESPDLSAYLIVQMDVLATIAAELGFGAAAKNWQSRADQLLRKMLDHFWQKDGFVSKHNRTHRVVNAPLSLLNFMPLVLGTRLERNYRDHLVKKLFASGFVTDFGLATESTESKPFNPKGYWRGPIWPSPLLILVDSLLRIGNKAEATEIAHKFCNMVNGQPGIYENYDPVTGEGLCDPAYTWTASVFLVLLEDFF
ncbi:hypothetical protein JXJ21_02725 [candidate division KSB1 bacterium]|nr:hypothetical protein [candidate division KSB1 bacterium]